MKKGSFIHCDEAVSEALSFILVLGIIVFAMSLLLMASGPIIENLQTGTHFEEMSNAFRILHKNINRVAFDEAPGRVSELIIKDGVMAISDKSTITINGTPYTMGSIEYQLAEKSVAYEGGGLWTKYDNNSVMRYAPSISISNVTPVIMVPQISGNTSISGEGLVRISVSSNSGTQIPRTTSNTTVVVYSEYYKAWERYFKDTGLSSTSNNSAAMTVTANFSDIGATQIIYDIKVISARVL